MSGHPVQITNEDLDRLIVGLAKATREHVARAVQPLNDALVRANNEIECLREQLRANVPHRDSVALMIREAVEESLPKAIDSINVSRLVDVEVERQLTELLPHIKGERGDRGIGVDALVLEQIKDEGIARLTVEGRVIGEIKGLPHERGLWKQGFYRDGAICTYAGSAFIAQRDTHDRIGADPPSPDWRLLVKRGRDGKDAVLTME